MTLASCDLKQPQLTLALVQLSPFTVTTCWVIARQRRGGCGGSPVQSLLRRSHGGGAGQALALSARHQRVLQRVVLREREVVHKVCVRAVLRRRRPLPVEQKLRLLPGLQPSRLQRSELPCRGRTSASARCSS